MSDFIVFVVIVVVPMALFFAVTLPGFLRAQRDIRAGKWDGRMW